METTVPHLQQPILGPNEKLMYIECAASQGPGYYGYRERYSNVKECEQWFQTAVRSFAWAKVVAHIMKMERNGSVATVSDTPNQVLFLGVTGAKLEPPKVIERKSEWDTDEAWRAWYQRRQMLRWHEERLLKEHRKATIKY